MKNGSPYSEEKTSFAASEWKNNFLWKTPFALTIGLINFRTKIYDMHGFLLNISQYLVYKVPNKNIINFKAFNKNGLNNIIIKTFVDSLFLYF